MLLSPFISIFAGIVVTILVVLGIMAVAVPVPLMALYIVVEPLFCAEWPEEEDAGKTGHPDAGPGHSAPSHNTSFYHLAAGAIRKVDLSLQYP